MKTMICVVLDRSGSMGGRENDVINGVNAFLTEQKKLPDPADIAFVRFDTESIERFRQMGPLAECAPLTLDDFRPRGGTPLLDAVGKTIAQLEQDWREKRPERAIVVIATDGEENSSREYTKEKLKGMITARQASGMWAFIFLGADIDAFDAAGSIGIYAANTGGHVNSARGTRMAYAATSDTVAAMRSTGHMVADNLGGQIDAVEEAVDVTPKVVPLAQSTTAAPWVPPSSTADSSNSWSPPA